MPSHQCALPLRGLEWVGFPLPHLLPVQFLFTWILPRAKIWLNEHIRFLGIWNWVPSSRSYLQSKPVSLLQFSLPEIDRAVPWQAINWPRLPCILSSVQRQDKSPPLATGGCISIYRSHSTFHVSVLSFLHLTTAYHIIYISKITLLFKT